MSSACLFQKNCCFLQLFLTAFFGYHVGCAEAEQDGYAAAEGGFLVASFGGVSREMEIIKDTTFFTVVVHARVGL